MLTVEVEMAAVTRDADEKAAGPAELTWIDKVMLVAGAVAWAIMGVLFICAVVVG